jgi:hypothetical protein
MTRLTRRSVLLGATALSAGALLPFRAMAQSSRTYHALLVAVTDYPGLPPKASLIGPNHDAVLVRDFLQTSAPVKFLPENITVLADNVEGAAASPTRAAILEALASLAAKVQRDDFVYLHFSGHGAQQPQLNAGGDETDGLDEIFLPQDTGKWVDRARGVPNALVDNDISNSLDAIRDKGAFIWVIFDCCHSGTATRAALIGDGDVQERKVEATDLGIPDSEMRAAEAAVATRGLGDGSGIEAPRTAAFNIAGEPTGAQAITKGGMVAFFAAQTIETTPEMPLPKGAEDATRYGLFTYTIFSKLAASPNITYRQLGHGVLQQYQADARTKPTPLFEGELDARVFGSEALDMVAQWQIEVVSGKATIPAGLLHRLAPGTKLAILPSPTAELTETLGYLEIASAKNLVSTVVPVAYEDKPQVKLADIPANAYARLTELAVEFTLVAARPAMDRSLLGEGGAGLDSEVEMVNSVLDELMAAQDTLFNITLVDAGAPADIRFEVLWEDLVFGGAGDAAHKPVLFFLPASGDVDFSNGAKPPLVAIDLSNRQKLKDATSENLLRIFRATGLSRLSVGSDYKPDQVSVEFQIRRVATDTMEPLVEAKVPRVQPGDELHIVAKNLSNKLVDINILYVGSDYSITHIDTQRLVQGASIEEGLLAFTDSSFGMERMVAVLTEAPPLSEMEDLSFLQQGGVPPATRSAGGSAGFADMLRDLGSAPSTRSVAKLGDKGGAKGAVMIFPVETVPLTN